MLVFTVLLQVFQTLIPLQQIGNRFHAGQSNFVEFKATVVGDTEIIISLDESSMHTMTDARLHILQ